MAPALLDAFVRMMPRVEARRQLLAAEVASVPHMGESARKRWTSDRQNAASPGHRQRNAARPRTPDELRRATGALGIGLRVSAAPSRASERDESKTSRVDQPSGTAAPSVGGDS